MTHASLSQLVPLVLFANPQTPPLQVACWHWLLGCGQVLAVWQVTHPAIGVPTHVPAAVQVSLAVQGLLSLHARPSATCTTQKPCGPHTASSH